MLIYRTNVDITSPVMLKDQLTYYVILIQRKWRTYQRPVSRLCELCVDRILEDSVNVPEKELLDQIIEFSLKKSKEKIE